MQEENEHINQTQYCYPKRVKKRLNAHYLNVECSCGFLSDGDSFPIYGDNPYPIHKPFKEGVDLISKFKTDINEYNDQKLLTLKEFNLDKDRIMKINLQSSEYVTIPKNLLDFYNTKNCSLHFNCDYNPYYKDFLQYLCLDGCEYLVRPDNENNLCFTNLKFESEVIRLNLNNETTNPITSINVSQFHDKTYLTLLQDNVINLLLLTTLDQYEIFLIKKFNSPILDVKLNKFNKNQLGLIKNNLKFSIYDVETDKKHLLSKKITTKTAFQFNYINSNAIAVMNENSLNIFDCRTQDVNIFQPKLDECNIFSTFKILGNSLFVGTRHYLLKSDLRALDKFEFCSHLMKSSPCYMDLTENQSYLCFSNQIDEKILFTGETINSLPRYVNNNKDSLLKCQLSRDVLLKNNLEERLNYSISGIKLLQNTDDNITIYTSNCLGEIFKQIISPDISTLDEEKPIDILYNWINKLPNQKTKLHVTNVVEMGHARFCLNKKILQDKLKKFENCNNEFLKTFQQKYRKKYLGSIGAGFAAIWDEDESEEDEMNSVPEVASHEKVNSWIQSNIFNE